jgi:hypothetical protein
MPPPSSPPSNPPALISLPPPPPPPPNACAAPCDGQTCLAFQDEICSTLGARGCSCTGCCRDPTVSPPPPPSPPPPSPSPPPPSTIPPPLTPPGIIDPTDPAAAHTTAGGGGGGGGATAIILTLLFVFLAGAGGFYAYKKQLPICKWFLKGIGRRSRHVGNARTCSHSRCTRLEPLRVSRCTWIAALRRAAMLLRC